MTKNSAPLFFLIFLAGMLALLAPGSGLGEDGETSEKTEDLAGGPGKVRLCRATVYFHYY